MDTLTTQYRLERIVARFERGLFVAVGFFIVVLLVSIVALAASGKALATGFNAWPHPKGIAQCWTALFEQYGATMTQVTQTVSLDSAGVKYRIALADGTVRELVCHPASGKLAPLDAERALPQE